MNLWGDKLCVKFNNEVSLETTVFFEIKNPPQTTQKTPSYNIARSKNKI